MDKLWFILLIVYVWIVVVKGLMYLRLIVMVLFIIIWGVRFILNFVKKGVYFFKFWVGEEDYRWIVLRKDFKFNKKWKWVLFDLLFILVF